MSKMKREKLTPIFSYAVALDESGRMKNTVYCSGKDIFILNNEATIILKFKIPDDVPPFKKPISFKADDYDSHNFYEEGDKIVFIQTGDEFTRKKICGKTDLSFEEVEKLWEEINKNFKHSIGSFTIHKKSLRLIDEDLSHIEISSVEKNLRLKQRNVFSGTQIILFREDISEQSTLFVSVGDKINRDFGPVGIRTSDFMALFTFQETIKFEIPDDFLGYMKFAGDNLSGFMAWCLYDELGTIEYIKEESDGRQISQNRKCVKRINS